MSRNQFAGGLFLLIILILAITMFRACREGSYPDIDQEPAPDDDPVMVAPAPSPPIADARDLTIDLTRHI